LGDREDKKEDAELKGRTLRVLPMPDLEDVVRDAHM
jgi:hypothetical protein